jgi:hypothetical protein
VGGGRGLHFCRRVDEPGGRGFRSRIQGSPGRVRPPRIACRTITPGAARSRRLSVAIGWYHSIDLPGGVFAHPASMTYVPATWPFRSTSRRDLSGKRCLDVRQRSMASGPSRLERRGAAEGCRPGHRFVRGSCDHPPWLPRNRAGTGGPSIGTTGARVQKSSSESLGSKGPSRESCQRLRPFSRRARARASSDVVFCGVLHRFTFQSHPCRPRTSSA